MLQEIQIDNRVFTAVILPGVREGSIAYLRELPGVAVAGDTENDALRRLPVAYEVHMVAMGHRLMEDAGFSKVA